MRQHHAILVLLLSLLPIACDIDSSSPSNNSFAADISFLQRYVETLVLTAPDGNGRVAVVPDMQARVLTSTANGAVGDSFGWINYELIKRAKRQPHMNAFGGEDRFWLGPEGGQYSVFFAAGDPFDLEHWQTPAPIDWGAWETMVVAKNTALFRKVFSLSNYSETVFDIQVDRLIKVYGQQEIEQTLGIALSADLQYVGYESNNILHNIGDKPWRKESGLLSIWILGMLKPSSNTVVILPYQAGDVQALGPVINDAYFGKVPEERLVILPGYAFFKGDGQYRSKVGLSAKRAKDIIASYQAASSHSQAVLTIVKYSLPSEHEGYVNSMWEMQQEPYAGDVVNSYNDGPPAPGVPQLGPFYELESSSPALALAAGESAAHVHRTFHFQGEPAALNKLTKDILGLTVAQLTEVLK